MNIKKDLRMYVSNSISLTALSWFFLGYNVAQALTVFLGSMAAWFLVEYIIGERR